MKMRCPSCRYELAGCPRREAGGRELVTCPECGRNVDPAECETERDYSGPALGVVAFVLSAAPLAAHAMGYVILVAARLELGRWPRRTGLDDPTELDSVWPLMIVSFFLILMAGAGPVMWPALLLGMGLARDWVWLRRALVAPVVIWCIGVLLMRWDPAEVWVWLMD